MYQDIRSCVTVNGECSDFFSSYMGIRQGENVSPMLFSIFVNDLEKHLSENGCEQLNFNDAQIAKFLKITIYLLYVYDAIAKSTEFFKSILQRMEVTCERKEKL